MDEIKWRIQAETIARKLRHKTIRTEHLFAALLMQPAVARRYNVAQSDFVNQLNTLKRPTCAADASYQLSPRVIQAIHDSRVDGQIVPLRLAQIIEQRSLLVRRILIQLKEQYIL